MGGSVWQSGTNRNIFCSFLYTRSQTTTTTACPTTTTTTTMVNETVVKSGLIFTLVISFQTWDENKSGIKLSQIFSSKKTKKPLKHRLLCYYCIIMLPTHRSNLYV